MGLAARNSDYQTTEAVNVEKHNNYINISSIKIFILLIVKGKVPIYIYIYIYIYKWFLDRNGTIPTDGRHWSANFSANFCGYMGVSWSAQRFRIAINLGFLDRRAAPFFQAALLLSSPE
jgi:hypothetical protein